MTSVCEMDKNHSFRVPTIARYFDYFVLNEMMQLISIKKHINIICNRYAAEE